MAMPLRIDSLNLSDARLIDHLFIQADFDHDGFINSNDARRFFPQFGLSNEMLSKIWNIVDPTKKGFLTRDSFVLAMQHIQNALKPGQSMTSGATGPGNTPRTGAASSAHIPSSISSNSTSSATQSTTSTKQMPTPPQPAPASQQSRVMGTAIPGGGLKAAYTLTGSELAKYDELFEKHAQASVETGVRFVLGEKAKEILVQSRLPRTDLSAIWRLSDVDLDGRLSREEFFSAMHLTALKIRLQDQLDLSNLTEFHLDVSKARTTPRATYNSEEDPGSQWFRGGASQLTMMAQRPTLPPSIHTNPDEQSSSTASPREHVAETPQHHQQLYTKDNFDRIIKHFQDEVAQLKHDLERSQIAKQQTEQANAKLTAESQQIQQTVKQLQSQNSELQKQLSTLQKQSHAASPVGPRRTLSQPPKLTQQSPVLSTMSSPATNPTAQASQHVHKPLVTAQQPTDDWNPFADNSW